MNKKLKQKNTLSGSLGNNLDIDFNLSNELFIYYG